MSKKMGKDDKPRRGNHYEHKLKLAEEQSPDLVANTVFTFCYWIFLSPTKISFNKFQGQYECIRGGWLRKAISFLFNLLIPINTILNYGVNVMEVPGVTLRFMLKVAHVGYMIWGASFSYLVWQKMTDIASIFNELTSLHKISRTISVDQDSQRKYGRLKDTTISWILIGLTLIIASLENHHSYKKFTDVHLSSFHDDDSVAEPFRQLKRVGHFAIRTLQNVTDTSSSSGRVDDDDDSRIPSPVLYLMGLIFCVSNTVRGLCFTLSDLMLTCWGLQFRGLVAAILENFNEQIEREQPLPMKKKLQSIRLYMKFVSLLERFNNVLGTMILTGMVSEILYFSTSSTSFVKEGNSQFTTFLALFTSFIPFLVAIVACAEVHKLGTRFAFLLKKAFMNEMENYGAHNSIPSNVVPGSLSLAVSPILEQRITDFNEEVRIISEAVTFIHNDLAMNNVGFQGLGFFTISYGLIGSIVAAIATYSLLILQLSEKGLDGPA